MCEVCYETEEETLQQQVHVRAPSGLPLPVVAVYEMGQSYGGPEEGGWWYTYYDLVKWFAVTGGLEEAKVQVEMARETYPAVSDPELTSMGYHGGAYSVFLHEDGMVPLEHLPVVRPHYE